MSKTVTVTLTDEEYARLARVAARVGANLSPWKDKGHAPMTPEECLRNFVRVAHDGSAGDWQHPEQAAKARP